MNSNHLGGIQKIIPKSTWSKRIDLEDSLGVNEVAWYYSDVAQVINILTRNGYIILGGDVYQLLNNSIEVTYDNWYFNAEDNEEGIRLSEEKTKDYIESYYERFGENFIYSIVYKKI
ncbi:Imm40 family immunity protein [Listeria swaminathanii]|uniref:Imm40 family immunity protein n=1 Tax=Listeria swaminathanii TaxID=2713501 RepID=A0ABU2IHX9_9LIST|nr:Imm40 family immunity protein [Listeria swaminathanii]MDT0017164.1 Imm40 family immunity protein [Listeria swaminathanii]MDT0023118.1 Imm40 family immunity protein [Listeria swaminathanii]MDT0034060.1 Imm40 family immunity protein [Listeria swaminathanii]MDT0052883.1 Imm40 family immunity protein [Listeria swaminathanii]MDT0055648.1 Imm40 family immunity protein [Listeria swaminathanii]